MNAPPVQYVTTSDGYSIAYGMAGEGMPLVRVPSMYGHFSLQWNRGILDHEFRALSENFRTVLFDCRGQGSSTRELSEKTSLEDYVRDLELLVDRLGLGRFVLSAQSAMGKIAVRYAVEHPDRVIALILNHYGDLHRGTRTGLLQLAKSDWELQLQSSARLGWSWLDPQIVIPVLRDSISQEDFLQEYLVMSAESGDEMLTRLQVPVLVTATREPSRPVGGEPEAKRIAAIIPGARLVLFDDVYGGFSPDERGVVPAIAAIQSLLAELPAEAQPAVAKPPMPQVVATPGSPSIEVSGLSPRQREVLGLIAQGKTNREIAEALVLSERTVQRHIADLYLKIDVRNRAEAVGFARDHAVEGFA